jgi:hypothetical protein
MLTLEEMPPSRHMTRKPWHHHKLVAAFKRAPEVLNGERRAVLGCGGVRGGAVPGGMRMTI